MRKLAALLGLGAVICLLGGMQGKAAPDPEATRRTSGSPSNCASLAKISLPETTFVSATVVPAGGFTTTPPTDPTFALLPAFCRVIATATPTSDSQIKIEVWLPMSGWVGKFEGRGNGGFAGSFDYAGMASAIYYGYATASTDTGHSSASATDATWALGHPQKIVDFGWRGVHLMTATAQTVVQAFYATKPSHSYFVSCSDGGREGLMEAQRFPDDYNGILAGDPANNWTHLMTNGAADLEALQSSPASYISQSKLPALSAAVLAACNAGQAAQYLNDPNTCHFNPETLLCSGAETDQCLTQPEINALKELYAGATLSTGVKVFPGLAPGGELGTGGWNTWITGSSLGNSVMTSYVGNFFANMVYQNPKWTYTNFNVDQGLKDAVAAVGTSVDANVADLTTFNTAGGKLILYQGWNDPAVSPFATIQYYNRVVTAMGTKPAANSVRLFMVPGMHHCDNGPGPTNFGQSGPGPNTAAYDANHSVYKALETWVEQGVAPNKVITTGQVMEGGNTAVTISRPLCAYPLVAKYNGSGDQTNAANFHCANE